MFRFAARGIQCLSMAMLFDSVGEQTQALSERSPKNLSAKPPQGKLQRRLACCDSVLAARRQRAARRSCRQFRTWPFGQFIDRKIHRPWCADYCATTRFAQVMPAWLDSNDRHAVAIGWWLRRRPRRSRCGAGARFRQRRRMARPVHGLRQGTGRRFRMDLARLVGADW